jgi:hypothetical protein
VTTNKILDRGKSIGGLIRYLTGKGDSNEHTGQRVIAADDWLELPDGTRLDPVLDRDRITALSRDLDSHRRLARITNEKGWVWHCTISLAPGERLSDAQWAEAARMVIDRLEFSERLPGPSGDGGRAPCRWIAIHHGLSGDDDVHRGEGNDHIHLAVNLVREDLTIATPAGNGMDRRAMSKACAEIERRFGLSVVEGRAGKGMPSYSRADAQRAQRKKTPGQQEAPERDSLLLARKVRAAAALAVDEADFVRWLRAEGVEPRPRVSKAGTVTGYSVALAPVGDETPLRYAGGTLAGDLTLPRLRQLWPDSRPADAVPIWDPTLTRPPEPAHTTAAAARPTATVRPEPFAVPAGGWPPEVWEKAAAQILLIESRLALSRAERGAMFYNDLPVWTSAARYSAALYSVLAIRLEPERPGPLSQMADLMGRAAQAPHRVPHRDDGMSGLFAVAKICSAAGRDNRWIQILIAMAKLGKAIYDAMIARRELQRATALAEISLQRLAGIDPAAAAAIRTQFASRAAAARSGKSRPGKRPAYDPTGFFPTSFDQVLNQGRKKGPSVPPPTPPRRAQPPRRDPGPSR